MTAWAALAFLLTACASVDVVRLSNDRFPAKASAEQVELLQGPPACPYEELAQLMMDDASSDFSQMQRMILDRAAELGADAVIFGKPEQRVQHEVAYQSVYAGGMYSPWATGGWAYGPYPVGYGGMGMGMGMGGMGYMGDMAVPYDVTVKAMKGLAIRYANRGGPKC